MDGKKINDLAMLRPEDLRGRIVNDRSWSRGESLETLQETIRQIEKVRQTLRELTHKSDWAPVIQQVDQLPESHAGWNKARFTQWIRDQYYRLYKKRETPKAYQEAVGETNIAMLNMVYEMRKQAKGWEGNGGYEKVYSGRKNSRGVAKHNRAVKAALSRSESRAQNEVHLNNLNQGSDVEKRLKKIQELVEELRDQKQDPVNDGHVLATTSTGHRISFVARNWSGLSGLRVSREGATQNSRKLDRLHSNYDEAANAILDQMGQRWGIEPAVTEALKFKENQPSRHQPLNVEPEVDLYKPELPMGGRVAEDFSNIMNSMQVKMFGDNEVTIHVKHFHKEEPVKFSVWDRRHNPNLKKINPVFAVWKGAVDYAFKIWKEDPEANA